MKPKCEDIGWALSSPLGSSPFTNKYSMKRIKYSLMDFSSSSASGHDDHDDAMIYSFDSTDFYSETFYYPNVFATIFHSLLVLVILRQLIQHRNSSTNYRVWFHLLLLLASIFEFSSYLQVVVTATEDGLCEPRSEPHTCELLRKVFHTLHILAASMLSGAIIWTIVEWSSLYRQAFDIETKMYCYGYFTPIHLFLYLYGLSLVTTAYMLVEIFHSTEKQDVMRAINLYIATIATLYFFACVGLLFWGMKLKLQMLHTSECPRLLHVMSYRRVNIVLTIICISTMVRVCGSTYKISRNLVKRDPTFVQQWSKPEAWFYSLVVTFIPRAGIILSLLWSIEDRS